MALGISQVGAAETRPLAVIEPYFEPNQGQADRGFDFVSRGLGYGLSVRASEADLHLIQDSGRLQPAKSASLRMKVLNANPHAHATGLDLLAATSNYLIGNVPKSWRTGIPHFGRVAYQGVYPGIDLVYHGNQRQLEYDFLVSPLADVGRIQLEFQGAAGIDIDKETGDLIVRIGSVEIRQKRPQVYQETAGGRQRIAARYVARGRNRVGFETARYDRQKPLVIDPTLVFSSYFGGNSADQGNGIAVDGQGNIYVSGTTTSTNINASPFAATLSAGGSAAFIAKISPAGALIYSTYIAGTDNQTAGLGIALDSQQNIYLVGQTASTTFPTTQNALQSTYAGGTDAFVLELNNSGTNLVFSTYYGGAKMDYFDSVAVDGSGNIHIGGTSASPNFPVLNAAEPASPTGEGAVALKILSNKTLSFATYLGNSNFANAIAIDSSGDLYVVGDVSTATFPTTANALQTTYGGSTDGWVQELSPTGQILYSTYIGGSGADAVRGAQVDPSGNLIITGNTASPNFPLVNPLQPAYGGGASDAFVAKLNSTGSSLIFSTYLGGNGADVADFLALDAVGNAYVTGYTTSTNFPAAQPAQASNGGGTDAFVTELNNAGTTMPFSTYLGGGGTDQANGVVVSSTGIVYVTGSTTSGNFPTEDPLQAQYGGGATDAFIAGIGGLCPVSVSPAGAALGLAGGSGSITVTAASNCIWGVTTPASWITINSPASGSGAGNGTVSYTAASNPMPVAGSIIVGTDGFTVVEADPPSLASIASSSAIAGSIVSVTLTGTNFVSGTAVSANNSGVTFSNVTVVNSMEITATMTVAPSTPLGNVTVTVTTFVGTSGAVNLTVTQSNVNASSVSLFPASVAGGISTTANTVTLSGPAPSGLAIVTLQSSNAAATVPASITIAAGATFSPAFSITTSPVINTTPVTISATYNGVTVTATLMVTPQGESGTPVLLLQLGSQELGGSQNGSTVTPTVGPPGLTGQVVINGAGSMNFVSAGGDGVYFLNCCGNSNNAYYQFTGSAIGTVFNTSRGMITFYLESRYTFAQRLLNGSGQRWAFDVRDGNGTHLFGFMTQVSGESLIFTFVEAGTSSFYFVPAGTEDTLFGAGAVLQVSLAWAGGVSGLYLNGQLVKSVQMPAATPNWNAASNFDLGAYQYQTYGGYDSEDDVMAYFTVLGSPLMVSITSPAAGASESATVTVMATASDLVPLSSVQFQLDGANLGSAVTGAGPNYSLSWDTTTTNDGNHTLTAIATDSTGYSTTSAGVSVTVNNIYTACDIQKNLKINVSDLQLIINEALGASAGVNDLNGDGVVNVADVQIEMNAVVGGGCAAS